MVIVRTGGRKTWIKLEVKQVENKQFEKHKRTEYKELESQYFSLVVAKICFCFPEKFSGFLVFSILH